MTYTTFLSKIGRLAAVAAFAAACAAAGAAAPSAETHLLRAGVRGTYVFLPSVDVKSKDDAEAWLRWAESVFCDRPGSFHVLWDRGGEVPLRSAQPGDASILLRDGDDAVDPSCRVRFEVCKAQAAGERDFSLRLAAPAAPGAGSPDVLCFTNAWVLSRDRLIERWRALLARDAARGADAVRGEVRALRGSGRFQRDGGEAWRAGVDAFVAGNPALWQGVSVRNETGVGVSVSVGGGKPVSVPAGAEKKIGPFRSWSARKLEWTAEPDDPRLCARDFERIGSGSAAWDPVAALPAVLALGEETFGARRAPPRLGIGGLLPETFRETPDALARLSALVSYADDPKVPVPAEIVGRNEADGPFAEIEPHRDVIQIELRAPGWQPFKAQAKDPAAVLVKAMCSASDPVSVVSKSRMRPDAKPWPKVVVKNGTDGMIRLDSPVFAGEKEVVVLSGLTKTVDLEERWAETVSPRIEEKSFPLFAYDPAGKKVVGDTFAARRGTGVLEIPVELPEKVPEPPKPAVEPEPAVKPVAQPKPAVPAVKPSVKPAAQPKPAVTSSTKPKMPPPPLPKAAEIETAHERLVAIVGWGAKSNRSGEIAQQKKTATRDRLSALFALRMPERPEAGDEETLDALLGVVAHFSECRAGCASCIARRAKTLGRGLDPKTEAFEVLSGWKASEQATFGKDVVESDSKKSDAKRTCSFERRRLAFKLPSWVEPFRKAVADDDPRGVAFSFGEATKLWYGRAEPRSDAAASTLERVARHVELCPGCAECNDFRATVRRAPTPQARREELLRALLCSSQLLERSKPLSEEEFEKFRVMIRDSEKENGTAGKEDGK